MASEKEQLIIEVIDKATKELRNIRKELQGTNTSLKETEKSSKTTGTSFLEIAKGIGVFAGVSYAAGALKDVMVDSVKVASEYSSAIIGLERVSSAFGQNAEEAAAAAKSLAEDGLMSVTEASAGLKNLLATGFSLPEAINLMNAFKDSAAFNRQGTLEFGQAIEGATQGLKNQNSIMVDNAGVTKNLSVILKEAGYSQDDLMNVTTDSSVRLALYNGILKETSAFTGDASAMAETFQGKQSQLNAAIKEAKTEFGLAVQQGLIPIYNALIDIIKPTQDVGNEAGVATQKVGGLSAAFAAGGNFAVSFGYGIKSAAGTLLTFYNATKIGISGLTNFVKNLSNQYAGIFERIPTNINEAISSAQQGNIGDAFGRLFNFDPKPIESVAEDISALVEKTRIDAAATGEDMISGSQAWANAWDIVNNGLDLSKVKTPEVRVPITNDITNKDKAKKEAEKSAKSYISAFESIADKSSDYLEEFGKNAKRIKQDFNKTINEIKEKGKELAANFASDFSGAVLEIRNTISELKSSIVSTSQGFNEQMAAVIIAKQDELAELQKNLQSELALGSLDQDTSYIASLQEQIATQEGFLSEHADVVAAVQDEITEQRRVAGLDEIEALKEQKDKEISELQAQIDEENAILNAHKEDIKKYHSDITEAARLASRDQLQVLKDQLIAEREILSGEKEDAITARKKARRKNRREMRGNFADLIDAFSESSSELSSEFGTVPSEATGSMNDAINAINKIATKMEGFPKGTGKSYQINVNAVTGESLESIIARLGVLMKTIV